MASQVSKSKGSVFDALRETSISRTSAVDQVSDALRQLILVGDLAPGAPLREQTIADAMQVSRNTVREATRVLSAEGLVEHSMNQGARVAALDIEAVRDLYATRRMLEMNGLREFSVENCAPELQQLATTIEVLRQAAKDRDWTAMVDADMAFHLHLVEFAHSERITSVARSVQGELRLGLLLMTYGDEHASQWIDDHQRIHDSLLIGKVNGAMRQLDSHLQVSQSQLETVVERVSGEPTGSAHSAAKP